MVAGAPIWVPVLGAAGLVVIWAGRWAGSGLPVVFGLVLLAVAALLGLVALAVAWRALVRQQRLLLAAFDSRPVGRLICRADGRTLFVNAEFHRLIEAGTGRAGGNPVGDTPAAALERRLAASAEFRDLARRLRAGTPVAAELLMPAGGGRERWLRVLGQPLKPWPGVEQWSLEDVTDRREIEQASLREQVQLLDFMDQAPVGFYSVDESGRFVMVNATLARWLGCTPRDLVAGGRRIHEVLAEPPLRAAAYDLFDEGGAEQSGELRMVGLNGRRFQASVVQSVVRRDDGVTVRTRSVVRDLTPEREWQEALRLSEQRFQRFFEDAPIGIALVDADGRLVGCNRCFVAMIGRPTDDLLGDSIAGLLKADRRGEVMARLTEVARGADQAAPMEVELLGPRELVAQLFAQRLGGALGDGRRVSLILHFLDTTEQKNLELQFVQSQKMQAIGQLAGGVAHDFNNLLTAMIGFCDLLLLRHKPGDQSFADIMQIKQNANRAANLVRQLLAFSRQQTLQPRVLDVTDVLAELTHLLRRLIGENIDLRMVHGRDLGLVKVDQGQLEQVIINLAVNARDAMTGGGRLTITTRNLAVTCPVRRGHEEMPAGEYVVIEVIDTGVGIPPANLSRIFEPFFSTKQVGSGTGLGLSTVYGIVRQTGGFVFVDSAPGAGARFMIHLPRHLGAVEAQAGVPAGRRERPAADLTGSSTILLVEDEDAVRVFGARALRNKGYQVLEATSGEGALTLLHNDGKRVDLLITDVVMPEMDGPTLIRRVRQFRPEMKVILISGYTEDRFRDQLDGGQPVSFLPKPFSLKQLAGKVKDVLRGDG
jgi:two-component system cell cycle sensor histidine kinase/response regulator CckA